MKKVRRGKMLKPYQEYLVSDDFVNVMIRFNALMILTMLLLSTH